MKNSTHARGRKKNKVFASALLPAVAFSFFFIFFSSSCRLYQLERKLDPENAEFLSRVRYIITRKERKIFLELPDEEKEAFKEEFWKRRDPDPSTEENEFKMEYFNRMERADELFVAEGKPGWLTDRGMIYILFGPPTDRITYPMGGDPYSRCREIWYYGNFPVVFIDETCTGTYHLVTYDLSPIRSLNLMYMHELNLAQAQARDTIRGERKFFDFDLKVKKELIQEGRLEGLITIGVPYSDIWFKAEEEMLRTVLDIKLELKDSEENLVWEYEAPFEISISEQDLKEKQNKKYSMEIPIIIDKKEDVERLQRGKNRLYALLVNRTGGEELRKIIEFNL
ncbi:MAG: GWxTD domain-containing protein [Candidatus Aminicenantales bacterium]